LAVVDRQSHTNIISKLAKNGRKSKKFQKPSFTPLTTSVRELAGMITFDIEFNIFMVYNQSKYTLSGVEYVRINEKP
jgi:hypothetical protein